MGTFLQLTQLMKMQYLKQGLGIEKVKVPKIVFFVMPTPNHLHMILPIMFYDQGLSSLHYL